jgi:hypothetical protein
MRWAGHVERMMDKKSIPDLVKELTERGHLGDKKQMGR